MFILLYRTGVGGTDWNNARHCNGNGSAGHGPLRSIQVCIVAYAPAMISHT